MLFLSRCVVDHFSYSSVLVLPLILLRAYHFFIDSEKTKSSIDGRHKAASLFIRPYTILDVVTFLASKKGNAMALWEVSQIQVQMKSKSLQKFAPAQKTNQKKENAPDIISMSLLKNTAGRVLAGFLIFKFFYNENN